MRSSLGPPRKGSRRHLARRARLRRVAAAVLVALAAFVGVSAFAAPRVASAGVPTVIVVRPLTVGAVITRNDVDLVDRPAAHRPETAYAAYEQVVGRVLASPVAAREVLTTQRLAGAGLLVGQPAGRVAMTVPVIDPAATGVRPGSRVDLYATASGEPAALDVVVLAVAAVESSPDAWGAPPSPTVTLALDSAKATAVARSLSALEAGQSFVLALRH